MMPLVVLTLDWWQPTWMKTEPLCVVIVTDLNRANGGVTIVLIVRGVLKLALLRLSIKHSRPIFHLQATHMNVNET